jgi:ADP-ribose pyrophosphatase YjhB (NUDIX family)
MKGNESFNFCPACGGRLVLRSLKQGEPDRLVCTRCGTPHYLDPKLVSCAVVETDGGIVLLKRGIEPAAGLWVIPGGYVDRGETVEGAAIRETREECGLDINISGLLGIYSYPGEPVVVAVFRAAKVAGELVAGDETLESRVYPPDRIPWDELAFISTREALESYLGEKNLEWS